MSDYYLDASALAKRYAPEPGSGWMLHIADSTVGHTILLSEITLVEVAAALGAKQRSPNGLTIAVRDRALSRFVQDCQDHYLLLKVDRDAIDRAVEFTQRHPLRGYDAVQLATAWVANEELLAAKVAPLIFITSDRDLLNAAREEGLATQNPLDHLELDLQT